MIGGPLGRLARSGRVRHRRRRAAGRAARCVGVSRCRRIGGLQGRRRPPRLRERRSFLLGSWSRRPPTFEELGSCRHGVDHCCPLLIVDDTDLERLCVHGRTDVHRDGRSFVSNACQWLRSAWSMSSSVTPCLRALASMSTTCERYLLRPEPSTCVDGSGIACRGHGEHMEVPRITPAPGHATDVVTLPDAALAAWPDRQPAESNPCGGGWASRRRRRCWRGPWRWIRTRPCCSARTRQADRPRRGSRARSPEDDEVVTDRPLDPA